MGHRIELEEIECVLNQIDGVEKSCCLINQRENKLIAFYLGNAEIEAIKSGLQKKIPSYMIPHKIIKMNQIPLNKNGKTDRTYFEKMKEVII